MGESTTFEGRFHTVRTTRDRSRFGLVGGLAALALTASACVSGIPTSGSPLAGQLSSRTISASVTGAGAPYATTNSPAFLDDGETGIVLTYSSTSQVIAVHGSIAYATAAGPAGGEITLNLDAGLGGFAGSVTVADASANLNVSVNNTVQGLTADDRGNVAGTISDGTKTITFSTASLPALTTGETALDALTAAEGDFCAEAQQDLAGLDPAQVPVASIVNGRHSPRSAFAGSKSVLTPLTVQTWTDTLDVGTAAGNTATISNHISCKTRSADHIATTGVTTSATEGLCSAINQKSIDMALAQMTPAEQAAALIPTLGTDVVRQTGTEWTTPLTAGAEFNGTTLRAHALLVQWTDPNYTIFPDTIRGVHYCTTWSPAYAYWYLTTSTGGVPVN